MAAVVCRSILPAGLRFAPALPATSSLLSITPLQSLLKPHYLLSRLLSSAAAETAMADAARPLVICGPSGVGKSTLIERMKAAFPDTFGFSVSHTTRGPRPGEQDGISYHYVTKEQFIAAKENNEFIETAEFSGNMYGTSCKAVADVQKAGQICILDIEMVGVKQLKASPDIHPHYVFIRPPSMEELERRLRDRKTEQEDAIRKRLERAQQELDYGSVPGNFDLVIVNDNVDKASKELNDFMADKVDELNKVKNLVQSKT